MDLDGLGWTACLRCLYTVSDEPPEVPGVELGSKLAHGGMGLVYRGRQRIGRAVAVKVIHDELADDPALRARFAREARLLARLSHPGIVTIHDWGEEPQHYIVMELVDGAPIEACDAGRACELARQLCDAIAAVHAAGIVHRDLKPSNVLVCDGRVKLIDFGIAAPIETAAPLTHTGQQLGTPQYMAPEVRAGAVAADPAIDVYGIARLLRTITGELPSRIDRVVKRALADDPAARPSLAELRSVLAPRSRTRRASVAAATCAASIAIAMKLADSSAAAVPTVVDPPVMPPPATLPAARPAAAPIAPVVPVPSPPPRKPRRARPTPAEPAAPATLAVRVMPWAMVSIDGAAPLRIEPPVERIPILAGRHVVELANPISGLRERRVVELAPGEVSTLTCDLLAGGR